MFRSEKGLPYWLFFISFLLILLIPGFLAVMLKFQIFSFAKGSVESWIGFWGSYLGGIVGLIAVVITTSFLIENQNNQHITSIESSKQLEREKFMIQFNIEKYEKALVILIKLEMKIDNHVQSCNEIISFVLKYLNYKITDTIIPDEEYAKYPSIIEEHDRSIVELLAELRNLEKIIKPFEFDGIDYETFQYLYSTRSALFLLNTNLRSKALDEFNSFDSSLNNCRRNITISTNIIYDLIKEELKNYNSPPKIKNKGLISNE